VNTRLADTSGEYVLDLVAVSRQIWAGRWWVAISVAVCTAAFITASLFMAPVYRAAVVLAPASADRSGLGGGLGSTLGQLGGIAALAGINIGSPESITEEALAVLRSRQFTEAFIADRKLMPKLFPKKWDARSGNWKVPANRAPTLAKANDLFGKKIRSIIQDKKTGLVTLQIDWTNREEAADWANDLVARLNSEMRARAIAQSEASVGYLEKELEKTSLVEAREAVNRLMESQIKQRMFAEVNQEFAFRMIDRAMAPDPDDIVRPRRVLMAVEGLLLGLALGAILVLARSSNVARVER
jgi:uncharacterized protein involved in exopolysaccharide biosynthesis